MTFLSSWDVMQHRMAVNYSCFRTTYQSYLQELSSLQSTLVMQSLILEGSRRVWLSRTGIVVLLRSDIGGSLRGL